MTFLVANVETPCFAVTKKLIEPPEVIVKETVTPGGNHPLIFSEVFCQVNEVALGQVTVADTPPMFTLFTVFRL